MSDKFFIIPIEQLYKRMIEEENNGQLFGIPRELFFRPHKKQGFRFQRYGKLLETPLGVAAGPHTQMTQNIITAWLTGARYIELKTVQTLDELNVSKPCIDMEHEGYNCEWSQELLLKQSYDQYLNAWILIRLLQHKWGLENNENGFGCIFNLSVGYNMEGILKPNVQEFLKKMAHCKAEKEEKIEKLSTLYPAIKDIPIPDCMSDNITLSTMHGCPPEEIEKIGLYLIEERGYHTTIKLNPTLLGPEKLRQILNQQLGFNVEVPDEAFGHDLKYNDAVSLIRSLQNAAQKKEVDFSLKLTNTLECVNNRDVFPKAEKMMYMSGKPLHPISINVAAKLQEQFDGQLDLSFSAGADCFNIDKIIACGIKPVTVCSDILKPGGYARLSQYIETLETAMKQSGAENIEQFILNKHGKGIKDVKKAALENLMAYAGQVVEDERYENTFFPGKSIKTSRPLDYFDCIEAPCQTTCPAHQGVPDYMYYTSKGEYQKALKVILETNPFPTVTGMVCDHACTGHCTRVNYDVPLRIRDIKRFISQQVTDEPQLSPAEPNGVKVAVIGAGPSGLSCAFYLAMQGVQVTVYETKDVPGGMVSHAIPSFRLREKDIRKDIQRIQQLGVNIQYNHPIDKETFKRLRQENDFVYIAVGAQSSTRLNIEGENMNQVMDAIGFLARVNQNQPVQLGRRVAIVGGGNSAADAARTAWRLVKDKDAEIIMLYRRTRAQMPADPEELEALEAEGVKIKELTTPVKIEEENGQLKVSCWQMRLGEPDDSGRRRPIKVEGEDFHLYFDSLISAIGQQVNFDFLDEPLKPEKETLKLKGKTSISNLYVGGDALHGPFNIITAVADGKRVADSILENASVKVVSERVKEISLSQYQQKSARRIYPVFPIERPIEERKNFDLVIDTFTEETARQEAERCLLCSDVCNVCVTVCPNRANVSYTVEPISFPIQKVINNGNGQLDVREQGIFQLTQFSQVYNVADFCNECGNCQTFCPSGGAPYKDKPKICLTQESFDAEENAFFIGHDGVNAFICSKRMMEGQTREEKLIRCDNGYTYETDDFSVKLHKETFNIQSVDLKNNSLKEFDLFHAATMKVLLA